MPPTCRPAAIRVLLIGVAAAVIHCGSSPRGDSQAGGGCFPDSDGINGGAYTFLVTVDDTGFSKNILASQNDAPATVTLTNKGTRPHGFKVGCVDVLSAYPSLPAGCPASACFPAGAEIPPLSPGESATVTFVTPTPDGLIYPFTSNDPADEGVPGLNHGQWTLM